jgi:hypothetical protein
MGRLRRRPGGAAARPRKPYPSWFLPGTAEPTCLHPETRWPATAAGDRGLEDKIVQRAVVEVLNAIYEQDFLGFSYGFRPPPPSQGQAPGDSTTRWMRSRSASGTGR